jgi:membrane protein DedA with SNARE-associated domain
VTAIILTPAWVAGIHWVHTWIYLITNEVTALIWAVGIGLAAYYAGPPVLDWVSDLGWLTVVGIVLLVAAGVALEFRRRRRRSPRRGIRPDP